MPKVQWIGWLRRRPRVVSKSQISEQQFFALADDINESPRYAEKRGLVAAHQVTSREVVVTCWNGKETSNTAEPGDWIVTALAEDCSCLVDEKGHKNVYVVASDKFNDLYAATEKRTEDGDVFNPISSVLALNFPGGFDILAPWGEPQTSDNGYLLLNGDEVYGNARETFEETYEILDAIRASEAPQTK